MEILTKKSILDAYDYDEYEEIIEATVEEQDSWLEQNGYDSLVDYVIRFDSDDNRIEIRTIYDAIQMLALKEGADLVKFSNGNIGYVGYYGNYPISKNCFEILRKPTKKDLEDWYQ